MKKMVFLMMTVFLLSSCLVSKSVNISRSVNPKTGLYGSGNKIPEPIKQKIKK